MNSLNVYDPLVKYKKFFLFSFGKYFRKTLQENTSVNRLNKKICSFMGKRVKFATPLTQNLFVFVQRNY